MRIDYTTQYLKVGRWTHGIMFEPFIEHCSWMSIDKLKALSKQIHCEAWWLNCDNGLEPMDVYGYYYSKYKLMDKIKERINLARFEIEWRLNRWMYEHDVVGVWDSELYEKVPRCHTPEAEVVMRKANNMPYIPIEELRLMEPESYTIRYLG